MAWEWLIEQPENCCSIRRMEYPEFQTGIFGRMESALVYHMETKGSETFFSLTFSPKMPILHGKNTPALHY